MEIEQSRFGGETLSPEPARLRNTAQLLLAFGDVAHLSLPETFAALRARYPEAHVLTCSTAGEIDGSAVLDGQVVTTAVSFERTRVAGAQIELLPGEDSHAAGRRLTQLLPKQGLSHVLLFTDGLHVNGTALLRGVSEALPEGVTITGGLSGDGTRFQRTLVGYDAAPRERILAAVALCGDALQVGFGSLGGWDSFGPERKVTRARGNVLLELDGHSALSLYKKYLGEFADGLPASGLLFPVSLRTADGRNGIVRTILAVDEQEQSVTFAGDIPEGSYARLMKANFDRLVEGAIGAARLAQSPRARQPLPGPQRGAELALLISCVGRKMVLKQRIDEEVEGVREVLGEATALTGFYSYGELCPVLPSARCELHNQTMTITTLSERA